jgi:hypothetical protein
MDIRQLEILFSLFRKFCCFSLLALLVISYWTCSCSCSCFALSFFSFSYNEMASQGASVLAQQLLAEVSHVALFDTLFHLLFSLNSHSCLDSKSTG